MLKAGQQVGGVLGVTLIGILFFGLVEGHARAAAQDQARPLRAALTATGAPANQLAASFTDCVVRRTTSRDPSKIPPGCARPAGGLPAVSAAFAAAGAQAHKDNFLHAIEQSLLFEAGVFGFAALLVGRLPGVGPAALGRTAPGGE